MCIDGIPNYTADLIHTVQRHSPGTRQPNTDTANTRVSFRQDFAIKAHGALTTDSVYDAEALSLIDGLSVAAVVPEPRRSLCMALKTNMLYDALLVPCIGAEFSLGRGWSVAANWIYAWWKNNSRHNYWRVYGGDLGVRKYIGSKERQLCSQATIWDCTARY